LPLQEDLPRVFLFATIPDRAGFYCYFQQGCITEPVKKDYPDSVFSGKSWSTFTSKSKTEALLFGQVRIFRKIEPFVSNNFIKTDAKRLSGIS
jgi:hypothetical protein